MIVANVPQPPYQRNPSFTPLPGLGYLHSRYGESGAITIQLATTTCELPSSYQHPDRCRNGSQQSVPHRGRVCSLRLLYARRCSNMNLESGSKVSWHERERETPRSNRIDRTRIDKVNAELVTLTYGTIVSQLCKDFEDDYPEVNRQLDKMGYNIGLRLIEDYLAKSNTMKRCSHFRETADMISRVRTWLKDALWSSMTDGLCVS